MKYNLRSVATFIIIFSLLGVTSSCRKAGKAGARVATKSVVQKVMKFVIGATLLVSMEEIMAGDMLEMFDDATKAKPKEPGVATIHNNYIENLTIEVSNSGNFWEEKSIAVDGSIDFPSTDKGLIAIHSGEGYYMLQPGKEYAVKKDGDKIIVEELDRPDS